MIIRSRISMYLSLAHIVCWRCASKFVLISLSISTPGSICKIHINTYFGGYNIFWTLAHILHISEKFDPNLYYLHATNGMHTAKRRSNGKAAKMKRNSCSFGVFDIRSLSLFLSVHQISFSKFAPVLSCQVERSFSQFKAVFSDRKEVYQR